MRKLWFLTFGFCLLVLMGGCTSGDNKRMEDSSNYIFYVNVEESKVIQEEYQLTAEDTQGQIKELCEEIARQPEDSQQLALLPDGISVADWELENRTLWLNFSKGYAKLESSREILTRAGVVRIFCQLAEVDSVGIKVAGEELKDSKGDKIGSMTGESFVENSGKDVNAYQYVTMDLYFTNVSADKLVKEQRKLYYSKNTPLERVVVEQLVKGPKSAGNYVVIPPETKILGVSVMDGIGYVNLDKSFVDMALPIQEDIAVQAIVTSLVENCNVEKVQISINGESKLVFRESVSLDQLFEPDENLKEEEENE